MIHFDDSRALRTTALALTGVGTGLGLIAATASLYSSYFTRGSRARKKLSHRTWYDAVDQDGRISSLVEVRRDAVKGGIPSSLRAEVWPALLGVRNCKKTSVEYEQGKRLRREHYDGFRQRCRELEEWLLKPVKGLVDLPSDLASFTEASRIIATDAPRTVFTYGTFARDWESGILSSDDSRMEWQSAQRQRLTRVLEAYAILDPVIGYTQGMNEIAALFLRDISNESEAFWCFAKFVGGSYRCHFLINPHEIARSAVKDQEGVSDRLRALSEIIRIVDAPLHKHLKFLNSQECMFAFRAVVVLMSRELIESEVGLFWDMLIAAGDYEPTLKLENALQGGGARLLLHAVAASLVSMRSQVMACKKSDDLMQLVARKLPAKRFTAQELVHKARDLMKITKGSGEALEVVSRADVVLRVVM